MSSLNKRRGKMPRCSVETPFGFRESTMLLSNLVSVMAACFSGDSLELARVLVAVAWFDPVDFTSFLKVLSYLSLGGMAVAGSVSPLLFQDLTS